MLTDWELWACASHYVTKHSEDALIMAAMRADELLSAGDLDGVKTYRAILRRIDTLLAAPGGTAN